MTSSELKSDQDYEITSELEAPSKEEPVKSTLQTILMICDHCKEKLSIKMNPSEIAENLKGGLYSVEVPHCTADPHSTIFYLSLNSDRVQVRGQVTANQMIETIKSDQGIKHSESISESESDQSDLPPAQSAVGSTTPHTQVRDGTTFLIALSFFLLGLAIAQITNYDLVSSFLIAVYFSIGGTQLYRHVKARTPTTELNQKTPQFPLLESLKGVTFKDPETGSLILTTRKASRILSCYNLTRSNEPQLALPVLNSSMSEQIPLLYMRFGNQQGILVVEHRSRGGKRRQGVWQKPEIPEPHLAKIAYRNGMIESGLSTSGTEFQKTVQLESLDWRLKLTPRVDKATEEI